MDLFYQNRRGPGWKRGWSDHTIASISTPPLQLLAIFGIVISLLWFSSYTGYKAQLHETAVNFQLFLFLLPVLMVLFMASYSMIGRLYIPFQRPSGQESVHRAGASPWGVAILLAVLLFLLSYHSSPHLKLFGL